MGCKTKNHFIRKYKPEVVECRMTVCEAFSNIFADLWDENSTVPTFMRCVRKRFVGRSGRLTPSDLGLPKIKGTPESVAAALKEAGYDSSKLCFPEDTYGNFEDIFRHLGGAVFYSWLVGTTIAIGWQNSDDADQNEEARTELEELLEAIGDNTPTEAQRERIEYLKDRIAETQSELACNELGKQLWEALPWTIFNSRQYIYDICVATLCKCAVEDRVGVLEDARNQGERAVALLDPSRLRMSAGSPEMILKPQPHLTELRRVREQVIDPEDEFTQEDYASLVEENSRVVKNANAVLKRSGKPRRGGRKKG